MKRAAICILVGLALSSPAFAIIRPPFPAKPVPPYRGHMIIIGDDSISRTANKSFK